MGKTRIVNLAKEFNMDVRELIQRLRDELGLQENFTYLSSVDDELVARVRQTISTAPPQVEELRVGDNVKRRRRVAPPPVTPIPPPPEIAPEAEAAPPPPRKEAAKPRKPKETVARVVSLPPKEKAAPVEAPAPPPAEAPPVTQEVTPELPPEISETATVAPAAAPPIAPAPEAAAPIAPPKATAPTDSGTALKRQRGKAKKKEVPARIISLPPEKPPTPPPTASEARPAAERTASRPGARPAGTRPAGTRPQSEAARPGAGPVKPPVVPVGKKRRTSRARKKIKRPDVPDTTRAKPVKKREVRERADLYSGGKARPGVRAAGKA